MVTQPRGGVEKFFILDMNVRYKKIIFGFSAIFLMGLVFGHDVSWSKSNKAIERSKDIKNKVISIEENVIITVKDGLMTVRAKDVNIEDLMEAIHQKAGIKITLNPSLRGTKVTTALEKISIEEGLKAILRSAGITSNALVFTKKNNQFSVDEILLAHGGETKAVKTDQSIKFINKKGEVISEFPLLKEVEVRVGEEVEGEGIMTFSKVEESDNGKYIAVNNIYEYSGKGENVEKADAIILDSEGKEVWRIKEHYYDGIVPSPNGKYVLAGVSLGNFSTYLINKDGLEKEIKSEDDMSAPVFSMDGSFFAVQTTTLDHNMGKTENFLDNFQGNLLLIDENGNELWRKEKVFIGDDHSFTISIIEDDTVPNGVVIAIEASSGKIFRFDKNGNELK